MALVHSLGASYVEDSLIGCYVLYNGVPNYIRGTNGNEQFATYALDPFGVQSHSVIPFSAVESFDFLKYPKMGYRNFVKDGITYSSYVTLTRSTNRGFRAGNLQTTVPDVVRVVMGSSVEHTANRLHFYSILVPKWYTVKEAITLLGNGSAVAVAVNADICLMLASGNIDADFVDVVVRGKTVGYIKMDGRVVINNKIVNSSTLTKLLDYGKR